jgi:hypothetical protein
VKNLYSIESFDNSNFYGTKNQLPTQTFITQDCMPIQTIVKQNHLLILKKKLAQEQKGMKEC